MALCTPCSKGCRMLSLTREPNALGAQPTARIRISALPPKGSVPSVATLRQQSKPCSRCTAPANVSIERIAYGVDPVIVLVDDDGEDFSCDSVALVAVQPQLFEQMLAALVDVNLVKALQVRNAVLNAAWPFLRRRDAESLPR